MSPTHNNVAPELNACWQNFAGAALKAQPDRIELSKKYGTSNMHTQNHRNWRVEVYKCMQKSVEWKVNNIC